MCILPVTVILVAFEAMAASKWPRRSNLTLDLNSVTSVSYVPVSFSSSCSLKKWLHSQEKEKANEDMLTCVLCGRQKSLLFLGYIILAIFPSAGPLYGFPSCYITSIFTYLQPFATIIFLKFCKFFTSCWEANSYYTRERQAENGKKEFSQPEPGRGFWVPGAFELDHLQPFVPIIFLKFCNFFTFMLGGQFL